MDTIFHVIEEAVVTLRTAGKFRQANVYVRKGLLFAACGREVYVRLGAHGFTSHANTSWEDLILPGGYTATAKDTGGLLLGKE